VPADRQVRAPAHVGGQQADSREREHDAERAGGADGGVTPSEAVRRVVDVPRRSSIRIARHLASGCGRAGATLDEFTAYGAVNASNTRERRTRTSSARAPGAAITTRKSLPSAVNVSSTRVTGMRARITRPGS
jgi:hypothetical protein